MYGINVYGVDKSTPQQNQVITKQINMSHVGK